MNENCCRAPNWNKLHSFISTISQHAGIVWYGYGREVGADPLHIDTGSRSLLPFLRASQLHNKPGVNKNRKKERHSHNKECHFSDDRKFFMVLKRRLTFCVCQLVICECAPWRWHFFSSLSLSLSFYLNSVSPPSIIKVYPWTPMHGLTDGKTICQVCFRFLLFSVWLNENIVKKLTSRTSRMATASPDWCRWSGINASALYPTMALFCNYCLSGLCTILPHKCKEPSRHCLHATCM